MRNAQARVGPESTNLARCGPSLAQQWTIGGDATGHAISSNLHANCRAPRRNTPDAAVRPPNKGNHNLKCNAPQLARKRSQLVVLLSRAALLWPLEGTNTSSQETWNTTCRAADRFLHAHFVTICHVHSNERFDGQG